MQLGYWDVFGQRRCPGPDAIVAVLRTLGAELRGIDDVDDAIATRRRDRWLRLADPVCVSRDGSGMLRLRLPSRHAGERLRGDIAVENGERRAWQARLDSLEPVASGSVGGERFAVMHVPLPEDLPLGYHRCSLEIGPYRSETLIIAAPSSAPALPALERDRGWGTFLPLYALRTEDDWGVGNYRDLAALARALATRGAGSVSTLPLLPTDGDALSGPSPYSPLSRLFWSELFIDLTAVPEARRSPSWQRLVESPAAHRHLEQLRAAELVQHTEICELKRTLLIEAAEILTRSAGERRDRYERFLERRTEVDAYARFRAVRHRHGPPWSTWPARLRDGELSADDFDPAIYRSHLLAQWLAQEQLEEATSAMSATGVDLYLDLPVGVPHDSFDLWRRRDDFAVGASAGAPPDTFFIRGQNWALPPLHPERGRHSGHDYLRACLRHHLRIAGTLRIDHVMALHRLFWVPDGFPPTEGVYVRYPTAELWAILALESQRHRAVIVGEDLGTVPPSVRRAMRAHGAHRIFVVQTEIAEDRLPCLDPPAPDSIACMNTHDMPTFASYREGGDLHDLAALGLLDPDSFAAERDRRIAKLSVLAEFLRHGGWLTDADLEGDELGTAALLRACLRFLADSDAAEVVINLEDLWLEERPQNVPGTSHERPNWRRRARHTLSEMMARPEVVDLLDEVDRRRRALRPTAGN